VTGTSSEEMRQSCQWEHQAQGLGLSGLRCAQGYARRRIIKRPATLIYYKIAHWSPCMECSLCVGLISLSTNDKDKQLSN